MISGANVTQEQGWEPGFECHADSNTEGHLKSTLVRVDLQWNAFYNRALIAGQTETRDDQASGHPCYMPADDSVRFNRPREGRINAIPRIP